MAQVTAKATYKQSRFSYARLEGIMLSTATSWDELETYTGIKHMERTAKTAGLTREKAQLAAEYMKCDPAYFFMETNEPSLGKYKGFRMITETKAPAKKPEPGKGQPKKQNARPADAPKEENKVDPARVTEEIKRQGWQSKSMIWFLDAGSCASVQSQLLRQKMLPLYTTENISWLLGVTKEYICGETNDRRTGKIGERHKTPQETYLLDVTKIGEEELCKHLGISKWMAKWLKSEPRYVNPKLAATLSERMGKEKAKAKAKKEEAKKGEKKEAKKQAKSPAVERNAIAVDTLPSDAPAIMEPVEAEGKKEEVKPEKGKSTASFKPVLDLIQKMDNPDLDKAVALIKALKDLGSQVTTDDFVKLEMVIETQRDYNNAQKNRMDALSLFL